MIDKFSDWLDSVSSTKLADSKKSALASLLVRIYIGSHIRDEGLRQDEDILIDSDKEFRLLEELELVELHSWYGNKVVTLTGKGNTFATSLVEDRLSSQEQKIESLLSGNDRSLLGFIISYYMSKFLSIEVEEVDEFPEYYLDWQEVIFTDKRAQKTKRRLFHGLEELGFAVRVHYYVSTRGSERRGLQYVTAPQIRRKLLNEFDEYSVPWLIAANLSVASRLYSGYKYQGSYEVFFQFDEEPEIPQTIMIQAANDALHQLKERSDLKYFNIDNDGFEIRTTTAMTAHQIAETIVGKAIEELIELPSSFQEETETTFPEALIIPETTEIPRLVQEMVNKKLHLFRVCARVRKENVFRSSPATEQIVVKFQLLPDTEDGLATFIEILYKFLIEASSMILQFNQSEPMEQKLLYIWLGLSVSPERREQYDQVGQFFRKLNKLRNYYSHLENIDGVATASDILESWIGNPFPITREEVHQAKVKILHKTISALSSLENMIQHDYRLMKQ